MIHEGLLFLSFQTLPSIFRWKSFSNMGLSNKKRYQSWFTWSVSVIIKYVCIYIYIEKDRVVLHHTIFGAGKKSQYLIVSSYISGLCWKKSTGPSCGDSYHGWSFHQAANHLDWQRPETTRQLHPEILSCSWIWFVLAKCKMVFWRLFFTCTCTGAK